MPDFLELKIDKFTFKVARDRLYSSCGSGLPVEKIVANGKDLILSALPLILQNFQENNKQPCDSTLAEMMDMLKIYNAIDPMEEPAVRQGVLRGYQDYWQNHEAPHE